MCACDIDYLCPRCTVERDKEEWPEPAPEENYSGPVEVDA